MSGYKLIRSIREEHITHLRPRLNSLGTNHLPSIPQLNALIRGPSASRQQRAPMRGPCECLNRRRMLREPANMSAHPLLPDKDQIIISPWSQQTIISGPLEPAYLLFMSLESVGDLISPGVPDEDFTVFWSCGDEVLVVAHVDATHTAQVLLVAEGLFTLLDVEATDTAGLLTD